MSYSKDNLAWLGTIPDHWQVSKLRQVLSPFSEKNHPDMPLLSVVREKGVIIRNVESKEENHNYVPDDLSNYKLVKQGQFTMNKMKAWQGSYGVSKYDGIVSPAYFVFNFKCGINRDFFNAAIRSKAYVSYFGQASDGIRVGQWDLSMARMKDIPFLVPPREEQDQIVRFLDWKVSSINKLINIKHKEISELNESLNTKLRDVLLSVPNVKEVPLKRICSVPMTDGPHETPTFVDSGIPFVSAEASHDGRIHLDECRGFITREQHEVYCQKVRPHKNDIFIVKSGSTTGKTVMVDFDDEFSIWSPLALVRCNNLAMPRYVFFYCTSVMFQKQVRDNWSFGTQPNIGMGVLENLRLPLPEIEEQRAIVDTLDAYWSKVLQVKCNLKKQIEELQSLKTRIIADTVTGKIDVRGIEIPEYEFVDEDNDNVDENLEQGADEPPEEE